MRRIRFALFVLAILLSAIAAIAQPEPALRAPLPPMGWNSWDSYGATVNDADFKANADVLARKLKPYGWQYLTIDIEWYVANPKAEGSSKDAQYILDAYGRFIPSTDRYPSAANGAGFKALADYAHSQGLKFGIHIVRGIPRQAVERNLPIAGSKFTAADAADTSDTCPWNPDNYGVKSNAAGQAYYDSLGALYANWGVDLVKADCIASHPYKGEEIRMLSDGLRKPGRAIVLSLSPGPAPLDKAAELTRYSEMWRISDDVWDTWITSVDWPRGVGNQFAPAAAWASLASPGHWPDADMLPLGYLGPAPGNGKPRDTLLTHDEQRTLMTLWSMFRSPLIMGGNLTRLDDWTLSLLTNAEVIAVDQHSRGNHAVITADKLAVWVAKPEDDANSSYVAVFNLDSTPQIQVHAWKELGLTASRYSVRDLWGHRDLGTPNQLEVSLPPHGCMLFKVTEAATVRGVSGHPPGITAIVGGRIESLSPELLAKLRAPSQSSLKQLPVDEVLKTALSRSRLAEPGAAPFHLKAITTPANDFIPAFTAEIEEYWVSPDKWRRTIRAKDFQRTVIVNGGKRFEQTSGDYYPKWIADIDAALFDVVPDYTVKEYARLKADIPAPDGNQGVLGTDLRPSASDGKVSMSWGGSMTLNRKTGTLEWISGTGFAAGFKGFEPFHGKLVPRLIETFPWIAHGDVNTKIVELDDLNAPDEALFAVSNPTPPESQLRFVELTEVEYRKLAIDPPVMKWPAVKVRPTTGNLVTRIVTDRSGQVRDYSFVVSHNMSIAEGVEPLIRQWRFKPFLVDGVPVEVLTTLTFAFDTKLEGPQARFEAASYYFKRGRDLTYPRTEGSLPFHLKGTFEGAGQFAGMKGTYEETWLKVDRWRKQVTIGGVTVVETRIGEDHYQERSDRGVGPLVDKVLSLFGAEFPGFAYYSPDTDWTMADVQFDNRPLLRVSMGPTENLGEAMFPRAYFFDHDGLVYARTMSNEAITYSEFAEFSGKQVPRRIESRINGIRILTVRIDAIEKADDKPDSFFTVPWVTRQNWVRPSPW
jgi:alpha-galactosidase